MEPMHDSKKEVARLSLCFYLLFFILITTGRAVVDKIQTLPCRACARVNFVCVCAGVRVRACVHEGECHGPCADGGLGSGADWLLAAHQPTHTTQSVRDRQTHSKSGACFNTTGDTSTAAGTEKKNKTKSCQ